MMNFTDLQKCFPKKRKENVDLLWTDKLLCWLIFHRIYSLLKRKELFTWCSIVKHTLNAFQCTKQHTMNFLAIFSLVERDIAPSWYSYSTVVVQFYTRAKRWKVAVVTDKNKRTACSYLIILIVLTLSVSDYVLEFRVWVERLLTMSRHWTELQYARENLTLFQERHQLLVRIKKQKQYTKSVQKEYFSLNLLNAHICSSK